jgi:hypothetical protein
VEHVVHLPSRIEAHLVPPQAFISRCLAARSGYLSPVIRRNREYIVAFVAVFAWLALCDAVDASTLGGFGIAAAMASLMFVGVAIAHGGDPLHHWRKNRQS